MHSLVKVVCVMSQSPGDRPQPLPCGKYEGRTRRWGLRKKVPLSINAVPPGGSWTCPG